MCERGSIDCESAEIRQCVSEADQSECERGGRDQCERDRQQRTDSVRETAVCKQGSRDCESAEVRQCVSEAAVRKQRPERV